MNIPQLSQNSLKFPDIYQAIAERNGFVAFGGDLSVKRLVAAYERGIFPWYSEGEPICWWATNPRFVLYPENLRVSRSLAKKIRNSKYRITLDFCFADVIRNCAAPRKNEAGTWITADMQNAYIELHRQNIAHSFECWYEIDGELRLAGGFYGVLIGGIFCGESMFAKYSDASKIAFARSVDFLTEKGIKLIDCQMQTEHLARFGAEEIDFSVFEQHLAEYKEQKIELSRQIIFENF